MNKNLKAVISFGLVSAILITGILIGVSVPVVNSIGWGMAAFSLAVIWATLNLPSN